MHKTLSENQSKDVSESECNIVHENLSQNNSKDVLANVITELKDDEHIEPSVIVKGTIYSKIFECWFWLILSLLYWCGHESPLMRNVKFIQ